MAQEHYSPPHDRCSRSHLQICNLLQMSLLQVVKPLDDTPEAAHTAEVVNALSAAFQEVLVRHPVNEQRAAAGKLPANVVLLRGCGSR